MLNISYTILSISLHSIEVEMLKELNLNRIIQLDGFFQFISNSTSFISWGVPVLLLLIGLFKRQTRIRQKALFILSSVGISTITSFIFKYTIDRPRPFVTYSFIEKMSIGGSPSFPSGHTTEAFAFALALCFACPKWYVIVPSLLWASIVGYTRMSLGVHYPSDVLAGVVLGILSVYLCYNIFKQFKSTRLDSLKN